MSSQFDAMMESGLPTPMSRKHPSYISLSTQHELPQIGHEEAFINNQAGFNENLDLNPHQTFSTCNAEVLPNNEYELLYHSKHHQSCAVEAERAAFAMQPFDFANSNGRVCGTGAQNDGSLFYSGSTNSSTFFNPLSSNTNFRANFMEEMSCNQSIVVQNQNFTGFQPKWQQHIAQVMSDIAEHMSFTDVTVVTATDSVRAHRAILASHSSYLRQLMINNEEEPFLLAKDIDAGHFKLMMQFFYTGEVQLNSQSDIQPLKDACSLLGVSSLMARLEELSFSIHFFPEAYNENLNNNNQFDQDCNNMGHEALLNNTNNTNIASNSLPITALNTSTTINSSISCNTASMNTNISANNNSINSKVASKQNCFPCTQCSSKFATKESLDAHIRIHKGLKPFECSICGKGISSKEHLSIHMRVHTGQKPFSCPTCSKSFSDSSSLRRHLRSYHRKKEDYQCEICQKVFCDKSTLLRHQKEQGHLKDSQRHECQICKAQFVRKKTLLEHCKKVHGEETSAVFAECTITSVKAGLQKSLQKCNFCERVFHKASALELHLRSHTGDKPYVCSTCGKQFARLSNLRLHERLHSGIKPFNCNFCDKAFADKSACKRHQKTHEKDH